MALATSLSQIRVLFVSTTFARQITGTRHTSPFESFPKGLACLFRSGRKFRLTQPSRKRILVDMYNFAENIYWAGITVGGRDAPHRDLKPLIRLIVRRTEMGYKQARSLLEDALSSDFTRNGVAILEEVLGVGR